MFTNVIQFVHALLTGLWFQEIVPTPQESKHHPGINFNPSMDK